MTVNPSSEEFRQSHWNHQTETNIFVFFILMVAPQPSNPLADPQMCSVLHSGILVSLPGTCLSVRRWIAGEVHTLDIILPPSRVSWLRMWPQTLVVLLGWVELNVYFNIWPVHHVQEQSSWVHLMTCLFFSLPNWRFFSLMLFYQYNNFHNSFSLLYKLLL